MLTAITIATWLTITRLLLTPIIIFAMVTNNWLYAFWLFTSAAATDLFDGALARARNERTFLGACLDPIADKVLVIAVFSTLMLIHTTIPAWFLLFMLIKELILIIGAALLYYKNGRVAIEPSWLGKATMLVQVVFIGLLFAAYASFPISLVVLEGGILLIAFMALGSLVLYVRQGIQQW